MLCVGLILCIPCMRRTQTNPGVYGGRFLVRVGPHVGSRGSTSCRQPREVAEPGYRGLTGAGGGTAEEKVQGAWGRQVRGSRGWDGMVRTPPVNHEELGSRIQTASSGNAG